MTMPDAAPARPRNIALLIDATIAASESQAEAFWTLRDSISAAERAQGPATQHDISVPVEAMPAFLLDAAAACDARFPGTHASGFGHLGDGNVHVNVTGVAPDDEEVDRIVLELVHQRGGSISAEHGIGRAKLPFLSLNRSAEDIASMRALKRALDPSGILNPGVLLPG